MSWCSSRPYFFISCWVVLSALLSGYKKGLIYSFKKMGRRSSAAREVREHRAPTTSGEKIRGA